MVKVTFQTQNGGIYWAICERVSLCDRAGAYFIDSMMEDSDGRGPRIWAKTARGWQIIAMEEV